MNWEIIERYRQEVLQITRELEPGTHFSTPEVIEYLNKHLPNNSKRMTKTKVNYLRLQDILHPIETGEGKERTNWRYTLDDVRRALLVELLKVRDNLSVQKSKVWLGSFEETQKLKIDALGSENLRLNTRSSSGSQPPTSVSSAYSLLRNRTLGTLLLTLDFKVDGKIPIDCLVAIRPMKSTAEVPLPYNPNWDQIRTHLASEGWFLAASDTYSKLYIYRDLKQLREGRNEIARMLDMEEFSWYCMSLQDVHERYYEVMLGLPLSMVRQLLSIINRYKQMNGDEKQGSKPIIQLEVFPGLSTLLSVAFINQPIITGGTPLSALVEIIATASTLWDYSAILVPEFDDSGKEESLRIQEYSATFPLNLIDKHVDAGKFLTGWCYSYNQSIVVDPTIENDPRIAFFEEEERPTAAAAIPAATSGPRAVGAIYVASRVKLDEGQKIFSDELLACLEILGYICGDMIARDQIEIETVRSADQLPKNRLVHDFEGLRNLAEKVVDEALRRTNPAKASHSWIYMLTLNIQVTSQDTITQWLCEQGIEITKKFLANRINRSPAYPLLASPLPIGYHKVRTDRYAFAILCTVDLPEEEYKQKIAALEREINLLGIGGISPRFYPSAITFRYEVLRKQLQERGVINIIGDLINRMEEKLRAGLSLKRGHQYLYTAQPDQAASEFEDVLRYDPKNWYDLKHLAESLMLQGTPKSIEQAIENCRKAVNLNPDYASAHCLLADCLSYNGQFCEALVQYEEAIALDSTRDWFLTRYALALASMTTSEYQKALTYLKTKMPELFQHRQYLNEPSAEAIARFAQIRDLKLKGKNSNSPEAHEVLADYHYYKGRTHLQANLIDKAIEDFIMGRKHSPDNPYLAEAYLSTLELQRRREKGL